MYPHVVHVFIDGGYLREVAREFVLPLVDPRALAIRLVQTSTVQGWAAARTIHANALLGRVTYYDALPDPASQSNTSLGDYWKAIEVLDDVHLGFGALRGLKRKARQKGVDVQITVDMLVGAFSALFDIAILVAGDADFVPLVEEVKRRGVMVAVAASPKSLSDDLRRVCDRYLQLDQTSNWLQPMLVGGKPILSS
jgi:uncharacterized LabA/DUF88 family protein